HHVEREEERDAIAGQRRPRIARLADAVRVGVVLRVVVDVWAVVARVDDAVAVLVVPVEAAGIRPATVAGTAVARVVAAVATAAPHRRPRRHRRARGGRARRSDYSPRRRAARARARASSRDRTTARLRAAADAGERGADQAGVLERLRRLRLGRAQRALVA